MTQTLITRILLGLLICGLPCSAQVDEITAFAFGSAMQKKGAVTPTGLAGDEMFIRRLWLDTTGRLPEPEAVATFLADRDPKKRAQLIERALNSEAYIDRWTVFFEDLFYNQLIVQNAMWRNSFHFLLRDMVAVDMPWHLMARRLLSETGTGSRGRSAFTFYAVEGLNNDFRLDYLDDQIGFISESMLGVSMDCISCHDGKYHLEEVNKGLSVMKRQQFWEMAAFLSQSYFYVPKAYSNYADDEDGLALLRDLQYVDLDAPGFSLFPGFTVLTSGMIDGQYLAKSEVGEGMRVPRNGGLIEPKYLTTGEGPRPGETRREALARMITTDRQFARNMVNRVWAHFFSEGFVEPLNGWDQGRLDRETAASFGTTVQPRDPALLDHLTDYFIDKNYSIKALIRYLCNSYLYQYDYLNRPETSDQGLAYWRGDVRVRRLEAEAIVDSIFDILAIPARYTISGIIDRTWDSTWQLPDNYEPFIGAIYDANGDLVIAPEELGYSSFDAYAYFQYATMEMLSLFGRSDRFLKRDRINDAGIQTSLAMMNRLQIHYWTVAAAASPYLQQLIAGYAAGDRSEEQIVRDLFQRILVREPRPEEVDLCSAYFFGKAPHESIPDIAWSLFNLPDFLYR